MRGSSRNIHTRYHVMEATGVFDQNPANPTARDDEGLSIYRGPVEFPKMLYHPKGETRVIVPGEVVLSPGGRESLVGQQSELVWQLAKDESEQAALVAAGWHLTPAKAIAAADDPRRPVPPESPSQLLNDKDAEIEALRKQLAEMQDGRGGKQQSASV